MTAEPNPTAKEFVAFCLKRKGSAAWPALYDEMCWVASKRLFRGMGYMELSAHGVSLGLHNIDRLGQVVDEVSAQVS